MEWAADISAAKRRVPGSAGTRILVSLRGWSFPTKDSTKDTKEREGKDRLLLRTSRTS